MNTSKGIKALLENLCAFLSEPEECPVCGRPNFLDCNDDPGEPYACYLIREANRTGQGFRKALEAIVEAGVLSDLRGDASGGHLLSEARAFLRSR
jgi:hypothetical protein